MRLLFTKEGVAIWSSHLDLMRALMRSFRRAGIDLKHSQGFTPHPELSILMPLSVGVESQCEIAEFTLAESCEIPPEEIPARLNPVLPAGIQALGCWEGGQKAGRLAWLRARLTLTCSGEMQNANCKAQIEGLFKRPSLVVEKHSKKGPVELDIIPMIRELTVSAVGSEFLPSPEKTDRDAIVIEALVAAQNPTLNPLLLVTAIETHLPVCKPDFVQCRRLELYDGDGRVFR